MDFKLLIVHYHHFLIYWLIKTFLDRIDLKINQTNLITNTY